MHVHFYDHLQTKVNAVFASVHKIYVYKSYFVESRFYCCQFFSFFQMFFFLLSLCQTQIAVEYHLNQIKSNRKWNEQAEKKEKTIFHILIATRLNCSSFFYFAFRSFFYIFFIPSYVANVISNRVALMYFKFERHLCQLTSKNRKRWERFKEEKKNFSIYI